MTLGITKYLKDFIKPVEIGLSSIKVRKPICDIVFCVIDFDVLTFYFCILCIMLHILNGAIHEVEPRWRRV